MASFLKSLGGSKKGSAKIVRAGFEDSSEASHPQSVASVSTQEPSLVCAAESLEDVPVEELRALHIGWGETACKDLRDLIESEDWQTWEDKQGLKIDKKTNDDGRFIGKGEMRWTVPLKSELGILKDGAEDQPLYEFDFIDQYLWDDKTKSQYDEFTERMLVMHDHENVDCHIVDQIFKGRFGISGRDFIVTIMKKRDDDEEFERLLIGAQSIPVWHVDQIERLLKEDRVTEYQTLKEKVVRGFVYAAGFLLERRRGTNDYRIVYLNDADVKSRGVPKWIVNRVKLDQLKIVSYIPDCLEKHALTIGDE